MCIKLERSSGLTTIENDEATWEILGWWHTPNLGECRRVASPYFSYFEEVFISGLGVTPQIMHFCCTAGVTSGCLMSSSGVSWLLWAVGSNCSYSPVPACDVMLCQFEQYGPLFLQLLVSGSDVHEHSWLPLCGSRWQVPSCYPLKLAI